MAGLGFAIPVGFHDTKIDETVASRGIHAGNYLDGLDFDSMPNYSLSSRIVKELTFEEFCAFLEQITNAYAFADTIDLP